MASACDEIKGPSFKGTRNHQQLINNNQEKLRNGMRGKKP